MFWLAGEAEAEPLIPGCPQELSEGTEYLFSNWLEGTGAVGEEAFWAWTDENGWNVWKDWAEAGLAPGLVWSVPGYGTYAF